jgi:hypothetical protein
MAELVLYVGSGSIGLLPLTDGLMLAVSSFFFGYITLDALLKLVKKFNVAYVALGLGLLIIAVALLGFA